MPPLVPDPIPVPSKVGREATRAAILRGMAQYGWEVEREAATRVYARLEVRRHVAVVRIEYGEEAVVLHYYRSEELGCDRVWAPCERIHWSYNRWVKNLANAIENEIRTPHALEAAQP